MIAPSSVTLRHPNLINSRDGRDIWLRSESLLPSVRFLNSSEWRIALCIYARKIAFKDLN